MGGVIGKLSGLSLSELPDAKKGSLQTETESGDASGNYCTPKKKFIAEELLDPRSATIGIRRTPLVLVKVVENETPVRAPYLETDLDEAVEAAESDISTPKNEFSEDNISAERNESFERVRNENFERDINEAFEREINETFEREINESFETEQEPVYPIEYLDKKNSISKDEDVEAILIQKPIDSDDEIITCEGKILNSPAVNKIKRTTIIYEDNTTTSESTPIKSKNGRTPLGLVSTNSSPLPSPLGGGKPWRGFNEERIRLGLENTPPSTGPFLESVQSAPGKVGVKRSKKWTRANWAKDESLII